MHGVYERFGYSKLLHNDSTPAGSDSCRIYQDAGATAWDLKVFIQDGRTVESHGTRDSGCVNYDFDMSSPVNRAVFHDSKHGETFEL